MKANTVSGSIILRNVLCLNLSVWLFFNLGVPSTLIQEQLEEGTATPEATIQPTETASPLDTETSIPALPSPTETPLSTLPAEQATLAVPLSNESLPGEFVSGEVLVRFRKKASKESIDKCLESVDASIASTIGELNALVLSVPAEETADSIFHLQSCPDLRYVEPNYVMHIADIIPSDPGWGNQYGLTNIRAPQGWELNTGSASVTIAIVDTGIDLTHPDLAGKLVGGTDIVNGDNHPQDDNGHGTHVAGIAAAFSNNGTGVAGVSWGARLMPVKVLNASGNGTYADVADGIIWAADHGAQIINLSVGGDRASQILQDAVEYAASRGVLLVAATGNRGNNFVFYPARYPNVIAVAATDRLNVRAGTSNYGPEVDLSAPGVSIYSTFPGGYSYLNGTSMATPFVSGLAAILLGIPGNGSPAVVTQQMENTALDLGPAGRDDLYGYGLIQMDAALQLIVQNVTSTSPSSGSGNPLPGLSGRSIQLPTFTLTATASASPAPTETVPASSTLAPADSPTPSRPDDPEVIALETEIPRTTVTTNWFLPCCGGTLILLGILLFWLAARERKKHNRLFSRVR